jgi:hypothetical protein
MQGSDFAKSIREQIRKLGEAIRELGSGALFPNLNVHYDLVREARSLRIDSRTLVCEKLRTIANKCEPVCEYCHDITIIIILRIRGQSMKKTGARVGQSRSHMNSLVANVFAILFSNCLNWPTDLAKSVH